MKGSSEWKLLFEWCSPGTKVYDELTIQRSDINDFLDILQYIINNFVISFVEI